MSYNISIVAPLFNESEIFPLLIERLNAMVAMSDEKIEIVLINDGSSDATEALMLQTALRYKNYNCISLARNFGHQIALTAGLSVATATEAILIIDGDLQDPPEFLAPMLAIMRAGSDVVYAVRKKRKESFFKRLTAKIFYRLLRTISYVKIPIDSGDFCLLSRRVVDIMNKMPEHSRYMRGLRTWVGFTQTPFEFDRDERSHGETKYNLKKMIAFALTGIFNFSTFPIKLIARIGYYSILISIFYAAYVIYRKIVYNDVAQGFTSLVIIIMFFSGIQMFFLGIMGEYLLNIFFQVKGRPLFIIKDQIREGNVIKL